MTTDNRTNEPNKYSGFLARQNHQRDPWRGIGAKCLCGKVFDLDVDHALHQVEEILCAALGAAQGAAPQDNGKCGGCRDLGPHRNVPGCQYYEAPELPSGVDEDKLAEVIWQEQSDRVRDGYVIHTRETARSTARAVAEWLKGQGR